MALPDSWRVPPSGARTVMHIDTSETVREGGYPTAIDPAYLARLDELLGLRVGHLPLFARRGEWELRPQFCQEGDEQAEVSGRYLLPIPPGLYVGLYRHPLPGEARDPARHCVWMSDCPPEIWSMRGGLDAIADPASRRVLITGLGLGVIAQHALRQPHVERVDVIERDPDVYHLVRHAYRGAGSRLHVHRGDAYTLPLRGTWDVAYHDIWPYRTLGNIPGYIAMARRWQGQVGRQLFWPEESLAEAVAYRGGQDADLWAKFLALRAEQGW